MCSSDLKKVVSMRKIGPGAMVSLVVSLPKKTGMHEEKTNYSWAIDKS